MTIEAHNLDIKSILTSGACFRVIEEADGSFTNILKDRVINIKQKGNEIIIKSSNNDNLKEVIYDYFDLNRDYEKINRSIIKNNPDLKEIVNNCKCYKILNQDSFEMCISYIISQNNNVKRISKSIEEISKSYGTMINFNDKEYYLFPTYEQLKNVKVEEFRKFGVGFRDKYLRNYLDNYDDLLSINDLPTEAAIKKLCEVKGIGLKVASCILLFGYKRLDVFPIDTWVKKYMAEKYKIKPNQKNIAIYVSEHFKEYSGLIIQYMFNFQRNKKQ